MKKGQPFFSMPHDHAAHHRMATILRIFTRTKPVSVWEMTCSVLGEAKAQSLGRRKATHLCERIIRAAEENDFIRRLPIRLKPGVGEPVNRKGFSRALAYTITESGELFVRRHDEYVEAKRSGFQGNPENCSGHHRRVGRHLARVEEKYRRRMSEMSGMGIAPSHVH